MRRHLTVQNVTAGCSVAAVVVFAQQLSEGFWTAVLWAASGA